MYYIQYNNIIIIILTLIIPTLIKEKELQIFAAFGLIPSRSSGVQLWGHWCSRQSYSDFPFCLQVSDLVSWSFVSVIDIQKLESSARVETNECKKEARSQSSSEGRARVNQGNLGQLWYSRWEKQTCDTLDTVWQY